MIKQWTSDQAWAWYQQQPWIVGCNFIPSYAINQLEMWQTDTFDVETIALELGLAQSLGFNSIRVYLHHLVWEQDPHGMFSRIDTFLNLAASKGILPILVIFDDCWNQEFSSGRQPEPKAGVHNSGWVQSPGTRIVLDSTLWDTLKPYVQQVLDHYRDDARIRMWDLYNEPGNNQLNDRSLGFLRTVFLWAREIYPCQPLTAGVWFENEALNQFQLSHSDVITFHNYNTVERLQAQIAQLKAYGRPMICTEYMARPRGSRFETHLPLFRKEKVGCLSWGLVNGKTQTHIPWVGDPSNGEWFQDIFRSNGQPYQNEEVDFIRHFLHPLPD